MTDEAANDPSACIFANYGSWEELEARVKAEGGYISGLAYPFDSFKAGWAHGFPGTDKVHYYRERTENYLPMVGKHGRVRVYESICHHISYATQAAGMFQPGNWPRCRKCQRVADRRGLK